MTQGVTTVPLNAQTVAGGPNIGVNRDGTGTTWEVEQAAFGPQGSPPTLVSEGTPLPSEETGDIYSFLGASLGSSSSDDIFNQRTIVDCLDATSETYVPLPVSVAGIEQPGQRPAAGSIPVVLAPENLQDLFFPPTVWSAGATPANALQSSTQAVDCLQYRSVTVQLVTVNAGTATVTFEASNDLANWLALPLFDMASPNNAPVNNVAVAANTARHFQGPVTHRYFRARVSTAVATGQLQASARVSMAPFAPPYTQIASSVGANALVGVSVLGTNAVVNAGVAGTLAVGGNIADGSTPTLSAIRMAGTDAGGLVRTLRTDTSGNLVHAGVDPNGTLRVLKTDPLGVIAIQQEPTTAGAPNSAETLLQILAQLKVLTIYIRELSSSLNAGTPIADDEAAILNDPTLVN